MEKQSIIKHVFENIGEIAKTADFIAQGLTNYDVCNLCKQGYIKRIKNGYYELPKHNKPKEEYLLLRLLPRAVVCVESALFFYGYSDYTPRKWTVAVPRAFSRTVKNVRNEISVKAYYVQNSIYDIGKTSGIFNGIALAVYDRERTICDCFKYRTKLDNEIFNKAVNAYVHDTRKNLATLASYAKKMGIYEKMMSVMEVLING